MASVLRSKARLALALAKSTATTTATPRVMPRIINTLCQGRRSRVRQPTFQSVREEKVAL